MKNNTHTHATAAYADMNPRAEARYRELTRRARIAIGIAHWVVIALSVALITFISYDTFNNIPFLDNRVYMTFQFWVCVIFMADFFMELALRIDKKRYLATHFLFFLISIPYLNIISLMHLDLSHQALYFIRFIPLVRGAYSLAMVVGYLSSNRAVNILTSYTAILFSIVYFASLIFYEQERPINSDVTDYWSALWWACMNVTTIGCYITPMSVAGKICGAVLAASGMLMLPLFTVFVTNRVKSYNQRSRNQRMLLEKAFNEKFMRKEEMGQAPEGGDTGASRGKEETKN